MTLDLPGFGQSGKNRTVWTFEQYAADINELIKKEKLKNVILIGHSMSGDILLLVDTKYPGSVIGIVGIDNLQSPGVKRTEEQTKQNERFFAMMDSSFSGTVEMFTKQYLFPQNTRGRDHQLVLRSFFDYHYFLLINDDQLAKNFCSK